METEKKTLCLGDGDFSYSYYLVKKFGNNIDLTPTVLESKCVVEDTYPQGKENISFLEENGHSPLFDFDAKRLLSYNLGKFDLIIWNSPSAVLPMPQHLAETRNLISAIVGPVADSLNPNGEFHITVGQSHIRDFRLIEFAENQHLRYKDKILFDENEMPGYEPVGDASHPDPFHLTQYAYTLVFIKF